MARIKPKKQRRLKQMSWIKGMVKDLEGINGFSGEIYLKNGDWIHINIKRLMPMKQLDAEKAAELKTPASGFKI